MFPSSDSLFFSLLVLSVDVRFRSFFLPAFHFCLLEPVAFGISDDDDDAVNWMEAFLRGDEQDCEGKGPQNVCVRVPRREHEGGGGRRGGSLVWKRREMMGEAEEEEASEEPGRRDRARRLCGEPRLRCCCCCCCVLANRRNDRYSRSRCSCELGSGISGGEREREGEGDAVSRVH